MATKKILWIDDMREWAESAQFNLESKVSGGKHDVKIVHANNEMGINSALLHVDYDLIAIDYHMEPQNGDHYVRQIREEDHLEHIPILFYTQDHTINLDALIHDVKQVTTVYRPELVNRIMDLLFK